MSINTPGKVLVENVIKVKDGDTFKLELNLLFGVYIKRDCRLMGIDTPELNTQAGFLVTRFVEYWIANPPNKFVKLIWLSKRLETGVFGRSLGDLCFALYDETFNNWVIQASLVETLLRYQLAKTIKATRHNWTEDELHQAFASASRVLGMGEVHGS